MLLIYWNKCSFPISFIAEIDGDFNNGKGIFSDEGMGSESDTMFGNLSDDGARSPQKNFNFSFTMKSPGHRLSFTNQNIFCDSPPSTSSGVSSSSSQSSAGADEEDIATSFNNSQSFSVFSSLKSTSMTLRSASACASGIFSSDSESNNEGASSSKRFRNSSSPKHMTLRESTRKHRRTGSNTRTYIFK